MTTSLLPRSRYGSQRVHVSWFIAAAAIGVVIGIALVSSAGSSFRSQHWLTLAGLLAISALIKRPRWMLIIVCIGGVLLGLWRGSEGRQELAAYDQYYGKHITLQGLVAEDVTVNHVGEQRIRLTNIRMDNQNFPSSVWLSSKHVHDIKRGDVVGVTGLLAGGFGSVAAAVYQPQIVSINRSVPGDVARRLRDWFSTGVYRAIPQPEAGLGMAYLVGQKNTVSQEIVDEFRAVGLVHAIVASGFHLTVLVMMIRRLVSRYSKYWTIVLAGGLSACFIAVTGMSPSMTRAGLVVGLALLAWYYGRKIHPVVLLAVSAGATALWNPAYVWGDIGWYLSFLAFAGVLVLAPLLHAYFWPASQKPSLIRETIVTTIAAQIVTLPLIIYVFGYYSMYALLANVLVVPLVAIVMLLVFIAGIVGLMLPAVAAIAGFPAYGVMHYMLWVVRGITNMPYATTELTMSLNGLVTAYLGIMIAMAWLKLVTRYDFRKGPEIL